MEKTIQIDGRQVRFKCTGSTPVRFREATGEDLMVMFPSFISEAKKGRLSPKAVKSLEILAHIMAKQADPEVTDSLVDWLDEFEMFSIYDSFPQLIELWTASTQTLSETKKKKTL